MGEAGPAGSSPYRLTVHPQGRFLLVTNRFSNFASVVDMEVDKVVAEVPVWLEPGRTTVVTH